jgi:hypothetical protein
VLNELVHGESGVVGLNDSVGDLGGGHNGEGGHHTVGELLADLGDEEGTHTGTGTTTEGVGDLETLEAVTGLSLATDNIDDLVDELSTLSVVTLGPVVSGTRLAENKVVGTEELTKGTSADGVHGTGLQVDKDSTGDIFVAASLDSIVSTYYPSFRYELLTHLVEVDVHTLQLEVGGAIVTGFCQTCRSF